MVPDELPEDAAPDALPRDADSAVPESVHSEFRRMRSFLVDPFLQAAGTPAPPPPCALFEDFFGSSVPSSSPIFLSWFERIRTALSDADAHLAPFLSSTFRFSLRVTHLMLSGVTSLQGRQFR